MRALVNTLTSSSCRSLQPVITAVFLVAALLTIANSADAAIWYVNDTSTTGDSFTSAVGSDANNGLTSSTPKRNISAVMALVASGDTVFIDAGLYDSYARVAGSESAVIKFDTDYIAVIGKDSNSTVIDPTGPNTQLVLYGIYGVNRKGLVVKNLGVTGARDGIYFYNVDLSTVSGCSVTSCGNKGAYFENGDTNTIIGNTVSSNTSRNLYVYTGTNNTVSNNTANSSVEGITVYQNSDRNTVTSNTTENNSSIGIYVYVSSKNTLSNNTVNSNGYGMYLSPNSDTNMVSSNTVNSNLNYGIYLNSSIGNIVSNNMANSNVLYGIYLTSSSNSTVTNNAISSNKVYGIYMSSSSNNVVTQNTLDSNTKYQIYIDGTSSSDTFVKNNFTPSTTNPESGIFNLSTTAGNRFTFTRNWWGSSDSGIIRGRICQSNSRDSVIYIPYRLGIVDTSAGTDTVAPRAPDTVAATAVDATNITVTWSAVTSSEETETTLGLAGYRVYRSPTRDTTFWQLRGTTTATSYTDSGLTAGQGFYYRVTSIDDHTPFENQSFFSDSIGLDTTTSSSNSAPYISPVVPAQTRTEDTSPWTISLSSFANDTDGADSPILFWSVTGGGTNFIVSMDDSRSLRIAPIADRNGTETVTLRLSDNRETASQSLGITLAAVNDTPFISPAVANQTREEDTSAWTVSLTASSNDTDAGDTLILFWTVSGGGTNVTVVMADSRTLSITPILDRSGTDTVTLSLSDTRETVSQSLAITLTGVSPTAPVIVSPSSGTCTGSSTIPVTVTKETGTDTLLVYRGGLQVDTIASTSTTVTFTASLDTSTDTVRFTFKAQDAKSGQVFTSSFSETLSLCYDSRIPTSPTQLVMSGSSTFLVSRGQAATDSVSLIVRDLNGNGITGQTITYTIAEKPSGSTGEAVSGSVTNSSGISSITFTAGSKTGDYIVKASLSGLTPIYFSFHTKEFDITASKWALVALNRTPTSAALSSAFVGFTPENIFHWNPSLVEHSRNKRYEIPTTLARGYGYFLLEAAATTLNVNGSAVTTDTVDIPLVAGWNQLGSPYAYVTRWGNARIVTTGGQILTPSEAQTAGIITNSIFAYVDNSYVWGPSTTVPDPLLRPWRGFWLSVTQAATLRFSPYFYYTDTNATTGPGALGVAAGAAATDNWTLSITASGSSTSGASSTLGVSPLATNGTDFGSDVAVPPALQGMTASGFGVGSAGLAQELKAPFTDAQQWYYTVVPGDGNGTMTLNFGGLANLPSGFSAYIVDPASNAPVKLAVGSSTFSFSSSSAKTFQIVVGTEESAKKLFALSLTMSNTFVSPNPGPGADGFVRFKYTASIAGTLRLTVLDLGGVRVIDRMIDVSANPTEYAWDLRNDAGRRIGTGVYVYILEFKSPTASSRIVDKLAILR